MKRRDTSCYSSQLSWYTLYVLLGRKKYLQLTVVQILMWHQLWPLLQSIKSWEKELPVWLCSSAGQPIDLCSVVHILFKSLLSRAWLFHTFYFFYLGYIFLHSFLMQTAVKKVASSCFCPGAGTGSESRLFKGEVSVSIFAAPRTHKKLWGLIYTFDFLWGRQPRRAENLQLGIQTCRLNVNI